MSIFFFRYSTHSPTGPIRIFLLGLHNAVIAVLLSVFLVGIQLAKIGYRQQKANLELARQKTKAEMQLLKTRIDPQFLFRSLDILQAKIKKEEQDSPDGILELSDILSYTLYECGEELVSLEKEMAALHAFLSLEKTGFGKQTIINTRITGNMEKKYIIPLTLLFLLQHFFHYVHASIKEFDWINIGIGVDQEKKLQFTVLLEGGHPYPSLTGSGDWEEKIRLIRNRLDVTYREAYLLEWEKNKNSLNLKLEVCL
ncbi:histidine kinase [Flavitalea flava]